MIDYSFFLENHSPKESFGSFSATELAGLKSKLPNDVLEFLEREGKCAYAGKLLWTITPVSLSDLWRDGKIESDRYVFMRSAFGACIYCELDKFYCLDPIEGRILELADDLDTLLNTSLILTVILTDLFFRDEFNKVSETTRALAWDEILSFVPAIPLGGSFETSRVEIVKMKEHLFFLSQLFNRNTLHS